MAAICGFCSLLFVSINVCSFSTLSSAKKCYIQSNYPIHKITQKSISFGFLKFCTKHNDLLVRGFAYGRYHWSPYDYKLKKHSLDKECFLLKYFRKLISNFRARHQSFWQRQHQVVLLGRLLLLRRYRKPLLFCRL